MSGIQSVSVTVYAHDPSQPRAPGRDSTTKITVTNQRHLAVTKLGDDQHHDFDLAVSEPTSLGMSKLDGVGADEFMKRVVMACNLVMERIAFSQSSASTHHARLDRGNPPQGASKVEATPAGITVQSDVFSRSIVSESVTVRYTGIVLDEPQALDALQKIHKVFDVSGNPPLKTSNLQQSLSMYLKGTQSTDEYGAFMFLYASLEQAVNYDGSLSAGPKFDEKTRNVLPDRHWWPIDELRCINNRLKHPDNKKHCADYPSRAELTVRIRYLRPIAAEIILYRLGQV